MATLQSHVRFLPSSPRLLHFKSPHSFSFSRKLLHSKKLFPLTRFNEVLSSRLCASCIEKSSRSSGAEIEKSVVGDERPPFDINLAVILAGFAFEAYTTPPQEIGKREMDAAKCQTVFLSQSFLREIYDGQLFVKLKKGFDFPAMDPWGTSDPYVILQLDCQEVKSKVKWGTKEPTWNEEFALNIKLPPMHMLQVAAWDANLVTPPKRMGNAGIDLEALCDGNTYEVLVELEGMGGGGKIEVEVIYKSFEKIDEEKKWWKIPIVTEFLQKNGFEPALKMIVGSETVQAREFVQFAFGQLKSLNNSYLQKDWFSNGNLLKDPDVNMDKNAVQVSGEDNNKNEPSQKEGANKGEPESDTYVNMDRDSPKNEVGEDSYFESQFWKKLADSVSQNVVQKFGMDKHPEQQNCEDSTNENAQQESNSNQEPESSTMAHMDSSQDHHEPGEDSWSDKQFWRKLADSVNQNVVKKLGIPVPEKLKLDGFELLKSIGLQSQEMAEAKYVESGLAAPNSQETSDYGADAGSESNIMQASLPDIKKVTQDILRQTDSILGAVMVVNAAVSKLNKGASQSAKCEDASTEKKTEGSGVTESIMMATQPNGLVLSEKEAEEMRALFSTAESAMEAWALLANALGHPTFIKSEFEKICFLDNAETDTQVAIWRDLERKRLVIAFRGTEQSRWKDLRTDLMLVPAGAKCEDASTEKKTEGSGVTESIMMATQPNGLVLSEKEAEEMRALFSTAESAMEAWALLANALGHPTFIKSEFEKICFLDNAETDTQVAIWRDLERKRLVIAFRGTEQSRWKDLRTDLMLVPAGLNPERIGGDFKQEVQVHSGFLSAYDSVRTRLITLIKQAINYRGDLADNLPKWHIYVTGHSLGGALSTLLALELSSSQLAKRGAIRVTVYNFGSPRVGNRRFAEVYNEKVKDSWRVVNHRDIIPTVPRLMGYCHVAQPVYLATGDLTNAVENMDVLEDGYQGDVIEEATPDVLVTEFMRGEKELVEKILNTEINIFRSIRDGTALMQHMEDFYYIALLENVRSNYQTPGGSRSADQTLSI